MYKDHNYIAESVEAVGSESYRTGDRMSTLMFYLSSVQAGGRTVFPRVGAGVRPEAGSAVFWYNLQEDGQQSELSLHGACPTALGIKWVSNKWIREGAQIYRRPCPRHSHAS